MPTRVPRSVPLHYPRPALHNERLQCHAAGQVVLKLKTPWRGGATHLAMRPLEFTQQPAAIVPRLRVALPSA